MAKIASSQDGKDWIEQMRQAIKDSCGAVHPNLRISQEHVCCLLQKGHTGPHCYPLLVTWEVNDGKTDRI